MMNINITKKNIDNFTFSLLRIIIVIGGIFLLFCSCTEKIDTKTDFDFTVKIMPVPTSAEINEQIEIRLELKSIGGNYDSTKYFVRYFQYEGKGQLSNENGTVFLPNDAYQVYKKPFRFYFTPISGDNHRLELTFYDSFEHEHVLPLNFNITQRDTL